MAGKDLGEYYALPVIASFEGIDKQVNTKLSKAFGAAGKQASAEMARGAGDGLKALQAEIDNAGKAYQKLRDKAADALDKITVEEKKLEKARSGGKEDQIAAAEARLAKARRDSARATREAEDGHRALTAVQKRLGDGSDDLGRRFGKLSGLASGLGSTLSSAGAIAGGIALGGIAALAAGALTAGNRLYELGAQFDDLTDTLQVKTGLSGKALDDLKGSVERLGTTNVPSSFAEIGEVAAEVTRNLHLTGKPLEEVTSRLANLSRMGQDVDIRGLGKAFRSFGVDVADQPAALNSLYEASTKSGLSIDDMTSSVVKGGAALRALGLNFGESAALVASFEDAGLDADKMLAGLTKGSAAFAKDGKTAAQGLRDTVSEIGRLIDVGDEIGATNLANKVFGAKGGVNFFDAIKSGNLDVQSLSESLQQTGLDINDVSDNTADWSERWQTLKNDVAVALEPLASTGFDAVNAKLTELSDWVMGHKGEVIDFFVDFGEAAISSAEVTTKVMAGIVDLVHLFDTLVMKSLSWLPGYDDEAAKAFNDSLGELSDKLNAAADGDLWKTLREGIHNIGEEAKAAAGESDDLGTSFDGIGTAAGNSLTNLRALKTELSTIGGLPVPALLGQQPAPGQGVPGQNPLDVLAGGPGQGQSQGQLPGLPPLIPGGGGRGAGLNLQIAAAGGPGGAPRKVGSDSGLLPQTVAVKDDIASKFTEISDIGGYRQDAGFPNEHPAGKAIDVMIPNWNTPQGKAYGDQVAAEALKQPGVSYVLWQQRQWNPDGTSSPMEDRGGATANHMDHVHVHVEPGGKDSDNGTVRKQSDSTTYLSLGTPGITAPPTSQVSAFGAGYQPGTGTPGYNDQGEPGYYVQDPKAVRQAQQAIEDADERVKRADQAVRQAEARKAELDADAEESQRQAAEDAVENAKADAKKARREAEDARTDAAETEKGKFTAAKEAKQQGSSGKGGLDQFGGLGSIAGSFLKETFGLDGSFFPDISNLLPVQMLSAGLNAFAGPLQGLVDGQLGIQQPGWQPGMPVNGMANDTGIGTSGSPFGMPDVAVPPMPPGDQHIGPGGPGAPGPQQNITIDQSIKGNVGSDPAQLFKARDAGLARAIPRIPAMG